MGCGTGVHDSEGRLLGRQHLMARGECAEIQSIIRMGKAFLTGNSMCKGPEQDSAEHTGGARSSHTAHWLSSEAPCNHPGAAYNGQRPSLAHAMSLGSPGGMEAGEGSGQQVAGWQTNAVGHVTNSEPG